MQKGRTGGFGHAGLDSCSCASGSIVSVYSLRDLLQMSAFRDATKDWSFHESHQEIRSEARGTIVLRPRAREGRDYPLSRVLKPATTESA